METPVIAIEKLTKRYGTQNAVDNVTFSVQKGEIIGFVGLNGAGKSTTINTLLGFLRPSSGKIELFGTRVLPETAHLTHQKIGFASGDMSLFLNLNGMQYFEFIAGRFGLSDMTRRDELIKRFSPQLDKKIGKLSRGNKQKIALIGALMTRPELVVLDEPSSGLDPLMQQLFLDLVREEQAAGTTIFMSSHYLNEIVDVCSRILLIRDGRLVKDVPAKTLMTGNGKLVKIVTEHKIEPPRKAEAVEREMYDQHHVITFSFKGRPAQLQQWLGGVTGLVDVTINDNDVESAFEDLYKEEGDNA